MSKIEWTEATWNPIVGCSIVSPGCTNCYAMSQAARLLDKPGSHYEGTTKRVNGKAVWTGKVATAPDAILTAPLRRWKSTTYFVNSMGDLFHEDAPDAWIDRVFAIMALAPQHTFQVLTKRAKRMADYMDDVGDGRGNFSTLERIPELLATPAAVRFVSAEPLLGPIDFTWIAEPDDTKDGVIDALLGCNWIDGGGRGVTYRPTRPGHEGREMTRYMCSSEEEILANRKLDWIIVGGESGPGARPMHPDWARSIRDQCAAAGVPFFFKQWGEWAPVSHMDEAAIDACYAPAPDDFPDATRRRIKQSFVLQASGAIFKPCEPGAFAQDSGAMTMFAIGKKHAGRLLDGVTHDAMPGRAA
jgi:protein gp37